VDSDSIGIKTNGIYVVEELRASKLSKYKAS